MLENEHQNQRFTQWLNKHFDHSLAANQYPELQDPEYLKSIRLHLEKLWKESNNVEQWTYAVKAYLKQKNLDKKLYTVEYTGSYGPASTHDFNAGTTRMYPQKSYSRQIC